MNFSDEAMPHIPHFNSSEVTLSSFFDMLSDAKHEDNETKVCPTPFRYVDYAEQDDACSLHKVRLYGMKMPFPARLHAVLFKIEEDDLSSVVSWQPHGRCFLIHKPKEFCSVIMPAYFKMNKFPSFLRQLNLYGFRRLTRKGPDRGGYYHECFLRNKKLLSCRIPRLRIKGNRVRPRSDPFSEPDFYQMPYAIEVEENQAIQDELRPAKSILEQPELQSLQRSPCTSIFPYIREKASFDIRAEPFDDLCLRGWTNSNEHAVDPNRIGLYPFEIEIINNCVENDIEYGEMLIDLFDLRSNFGSK
jgi:HSF-type DNA-binding